MVLAFMVCRFWRPDNEATRVPLHVHPTQRQDFAGTPQTTEPRQTEDYLPIEIARGQESGDLLTTDEVLPFCGRALLVRDFRKWIGCDQAPAYRRAKEHAAKLEPLVDCPGGES